MSPMKRAVLPLLVMLAGCSTTVSPSALPTDSLSAEPSSSVAVTPSPEDSATAQPSPTPGAIPRPFTVSPNPEADALFLDRDQCQNDADGYRVQFPEAWYTNTAIGDVEPCRWFAPTSFEVDDPSAVPAEVAIVIELLNGDRGSFEEQISHDFGLVGGTQLATRAEYRGAGGQGGTKPPDWRGYEYLVQLGPTEEEGPNLLIRTDTDMGGDYELNKAVLDRIVATMELIGSIQ